MIRSSSNFEAPFALFNQQGSSPLVLVCEHASNFIPDRYCGLGLDAQSLDRHIAWDVGALDVAKSCAHSLDASLIYATYSRLLLDLNRPLDAEDSIAVRSEDTTIVGNVGLSERERGLRQDAIYHPFHGALAQWIDARDARDQRTVLLSIHSFTPVYRGVTRPWQVGILADNDRRLADPLLAVLRADSQRCVGDNQPYAPTHGVYHSMDRHGQQRGIACAMVELRNDLIAHPHGQREWADRLCTALAPAVQQIAGN